ncbi:MAG TPA: ferrochelatase [Phycisphaerae bacterium]|nr:ferrochelatase [Phycisphaerae bacterium]HOQ86700.1 ferrochelatase [Phycisphaerae bacterium]HPU26062.1 ferrochelatase [Phycisphaerae bacterium]
MSQDRPFDAVLIVAFGGPLGPADVRPFLANVLRGRRVPPHRVEEVAANYELFGGVSPLTEITQRQAAGLEQRLREAGLNLPVYVGMRNWHPFLADTLREMSERGHRRAIGLIAAAHHSYSSCQQYKENVRDARRELLARGLADVSVTYVDSWYDHPLFIETIARHVSGAIDRLDPALRPAARLVFTGHSLPRSLADKSRYVEQLTTSARLVAEQLGRTDWTLVYQSRSGLPTDPWLEPDICDYLRTEHDKGLPAAVVVPIGFVCDHIEVLFDLDTQAARLCREIGLPMVRAETAGDDPLFIDMMADVVRQTYERFRVFPPLPITAGS